MLSRVADALYWMGRYVERAEHSARVLLVTLDLQLDLGQLDPDAARAHTTGAMQALGLSLPGNEIEPVVFDQSDPATIASLVDRARQNGRQVREVTSSAMWEQLNGLYWRLREAGGEQHDLFQTLAAVVDGCVLWSGVTDSTMSHGEGWLFIKLGQYVERADRVSRLISAQARRSAQSASGERKAADTDNLLWLTLLRSCSALEAYRALHPTRVSPRRVLEFLVLDRQFPRTVRFSVDRAAGVARDITGLAQRGGDVERRFGRLAAQLDYADLDELVARGAESYLDEVLLAIGDASMAVQRNFFLH
ncbi:MAG TPA: alpha-E domain-containing protein [Polyangiaceae bacterium]|jgi:uncharacterized alpha-E superfamily protein|nr:alpha-E domain-containing protein [Polyangiaceae bacterium]